MNYYFVLQYKMLNRKLTGFGIHPVPGYLLVAAAFTGLSVVLFNQTRYAAYVYVASAMVFVMGLNDRERNGFLQSCFSGKRYYGIRIVENVLLALPFILYLLYQKCFLAALVLLFLSAAAATIPINRTFQVTMPTPFYKQPFEFIIGFRKLFWAFLACYLLTVISISVGNFNLGIFSLLLSFFLCLTFYSTAETEYYVWIYALGANRFLVQKIKTALLQATLLCLPVAVALCLCFSKSAVVIFGFYGLGYLYLVTIIVAKYSSFPGTMGLPQLVLIALSIRLTPLLLVITPYFYIQSIKKLNAILK